MLKLNMLEFKKNYFVYLFFFSLLFFFHCGPSSSSSQSSKSRASAYENLPKGQYYFRSSNAESPKIIDFFTIASTDVVEILVEEKVRNQFTSEDGKKIANKFKESILSIGDRYFGSASDVDSNGKITVFIVNLYQRYLDGGGSPENAIYTVGFFNPAETLYGNEDGFNLKDSLFIDSYSYTRNENKENFYRVLMHEYQHLITWNERVLKSPDLNTKSHTSLQQKLWLNEGLSVSAEHLYNNGFLINEYINRYKYDRGVALSPQFISAITNGDKFIKWDKSKQLSNYSTAYLFVQWLRVHSKSGHNIYKKLVNNEHRGVEGILSLIKEEIPILKNSDNSPLRWQDVFKAWNIAFYFNTISDRNSIYGYKGEISFPGSITRNVNGSKLSLYPGESILMNYYKKSISVSDLKNQNGDFLYVSIKKLEDNSLIIDNTSRSDYDYLLVINKSSDENGVKSSTIALPNPSSIKISSKKSVIEKENQIKILKSSHSHSGVTHTHKHLSQDHWLEGLENLKFKKKK